MNSYWISSCKENDLVSKIDSNYIADVCVIGAGICGLSTAYYLAKKGLKVIVVDKDKMGQKTSGHTTAKITLQHGLIYDYLIKSFGLEFALNYFEANKMAIDNIKKIIESEKIDCDFEIKNNYVYTTDENDLEKINNEIKALNTLESYEKDSKFKFDKESTSKNNIENNNSNNFANFIDKCSLPFEIVGGIEVQNQAQFHPLKYMLGLAEAIRKYDGLIFCNSLVTDVQRQNDEYVTFANDYTIKSKYVVMASHYPFINFPGFYFSKMYQVTSYAIAIETEKELPDGMFINSCEPVLSFRTYQKMDKKDPSLNVPFLIISGGNHKTGFSPDSSENFGYKYLENIAKKYYPDYKILYKWDTRDCITLDKVPYIGDFSMFMPGMYVATGFNKWGMTSSNVAANIISDEILGIENRYSYVFNSTRFKPIKNIGEMKNMLNQTFQSFVSNRINIPKEDLDAIKNDNGGIIKFNGSNIGVYKNADGKIFAVNPTCTHLGCLLTWNNVDKTWDCPCHGSRFDYTGKNLYDPAFKNLEIFDL